MINALTGQLGYPGMSWRALFICHMTASNDIEQHGLQESADHWVGRQCLSPSYDFNKRALRL